MDLTGLPNPLVLLDSGDGGVDGGLYHEFVYSTVCVIRESCAKLIHYSFF